MNLEKLGHTISVEEKSKNWQQNLQEVDQLADALGQGVDEGIKETVAAFHAFEIHTTASHEGKLNRYPIPYIDVESPDIEDLKQKLEEIRNKHDTSDTEEESIREEILRRNLIERKKIIPLLEEFYTRRTVPYEIRLGITAMARGWSRVQSQGADFQEIEKDTDAKKERLKLFQEEMGAFTKFLKDKYFSTE